MKKVILILFILLCGITVVSAQTVQRTVKKPNFFMPKNALQSGTTQKQSPQQARQTKSVRTTSPTNAKATNARQPVARITKPTQKTASAANTGVLKRTIKTPNKTTQPQQQAGLKSPTLTPQQSSSVKANTVQTAQQQAQAPVEITVTQQVPPQTQQTAAAVNNADPFQIIFIEYFADTATIDEGKQYHNPRLDSVIASFVDEDHTLN